MASTAVQTVLVAVICQLPALPRCRAAGIASVEADCAADYNESISDAVTEWNVPAGNDAIAAWAWRADELAGNMEVQMTQNRRTVEAYIDGFRKTDRPRILSCLTDDVEWRVPGVFNVRGKDDFDKHIVDEGFVATAEITVTRWTEGDDVVVAEGFMRTQRKDGTFLNEAFCDVFEMQDGKIRRSIGYLMETNERITAEAG